MTNATSMIQSPGVHRQNGAPARSKRVLLVNGWSTCHGGSSTSLLDIVRHLDRSQFSPIVLCPNHGDLTKRLAEMEIPVLIQRNARLSAATLVPFLLDVRSCSRLLRDQKIDLIHANVAGLRSSIALAARLRKVPYIQHVRNPLRPGKMNTFGFKWAARIITNSDEIGEPLRRDERYAAKTVTVHNSVDLTQYEATDDRREEIGAHGRPVIGFVGQLVPRKGLTTLLDAMPEVLRQLPNAMLAVVGCSPADDSSYEQECRARVEALQLQDHVRFVGYRRDVPAWMRTFDVFVLPTRSEPFGKVVIEAMAAGCPVVASRVGGIPEIITHPRLGTLITPDDVGDVAQAIIGYLADPHRATMVGEAAAQHVRNNFHVTRMMERIQTIYTDVLTKSNKSLRVG